MASIAGTGGGSVVAGLTRRPKRPHSAAMQAAVNALRGRPGDMVDRRVGDPGAPTVPMPLTAFPDEDTPLLQFIRGVVERQVEQAPGDAPVIFPPDTALGKLQHAFGADFSVPLYTGPRKPASLVEALQARMFARGN